jgi:hypothetical protein
MHNCKIDLPVAGKRLGIVIIILKTYLHPQNTKVIEKTFASRKKSYLSGKVSPCVFSNWLVIL